jgi:hypothetical protein
MHCGAVRSNKGMNKKNPPNAMVRDESTSILLSNLRDLIQSARQRALRAVDTVQVQTCWEIGRHIVEFEQGGSARAEYGSQLLQTLAAALAAEFGRGFDISNLRYMRLFYHAFPIRDALRHELSWTHYRTLLRVESEPARQWYMREAASQGWTTRALERQISTLYYERLLKQLRSLGCREGGRRQPPISANATRFRSRSRDARIPGPPWSRQIARS